MEERKGVGAFVDVTGLPDEQIAMIQDQPVPTLWDLAIVPPPSGGPSVVQVKVKVPTGLFTIFLDPRAAQQFGQELVKAAKTARKTTGIIVPENGHEAGRGLRVVE